MVSMNLTQAVADELTAIKAVQRGTSFDSLATKSGFSKRHLIRLFNAQVDIEINELERIATALDSTAREVLEGAYRRLEK
jgi:methylphosphotriester-DNA--protein-cysteine methyltransferase